MNAVIPKYPKPPAAGNKILLITWRVRITTLRAEYVKTPLT